MNAACQFEPATVCLSRPAAIKAARASGKNMYPYKFHVSIQLPDYVAKFKDSIADGQQLSDVVVSLAGRVSSKRASGSKLIFYDLRSEGAKVQVMADARNFAGMDEEAFGELHGSVKRGDIIGITGFPGKSKRGELSIFPTALQARQQRKCTASAALTNPPHPLPLQVLSPCLHMPPSLHFGFKDQEKRYRQRYLDLIMNPHVRDIFYTRAKYACTVLQSPLRWPGPRD